MHAVEITIDYLANLLLGETGSFESRKFDPSILPMWVGRKVSIAECATPQGVRFLVVFPETSLTADRLIFISRLLKEKKELPVVVVADGLNPQVRAALTRERIQSVITGRQLFAPELGIFLNTKWKDSLKPVKASWKQQASELSKTARQVLVSVLLKQNFNKEQIGLSTFAKTFREWIAPNDDEEVMFTILSYLSRAVTQLEELKLITTARIGRERKIKFHEPSELWIGLCRFTKTTVSETALISEKFLKKTYPRSGETALGDYSNLVAPSTPVYAMSSGEFNELKRYRHIHSEAEQGQKIVKIEHWKADPYFLWEKGNVNPIDLALSLRLETDERVRMALSDLLKKYGLAADPLWSY